MDLFGCTCIAEKDKNEQTVEEDETAKEILGWVGGKILKLVEKGWKSSAKIKKQYEAYAKAKDPKKKAEKLKKFVRMIQELLVKWFVKQVLKDWVQPDLWKAGLGAILEDAQVQKALVAFVAGEKNAPDNLSKALEKAGPKAIKALLKSVQEYREKAAHGALSLLLKNLKHLRTQQDHRDDVADGEDGLEEPDSDDDGGKQHKTRESHHHGDLHADDLGLTMEDLHGHDLTMAMEDLLHSHGGTGLGGYNFEEQAYHEGLDAVPDDFVDDPPEVDD